MSCTVNLHQMSPFTRQVYTTERDLLQKTAQDTSLAGKLKSTLLGRVTTLVASLFLHAEAVCRAVYICFLSIRDIFSRSSEDLLKKQKVECSVAYDLSLKSFFAVFSQKLLSSLIEQKPVENEEPAEVDEPVQQVQARPNPVVEAAQRAAPAAAVNLDRDQVRIDLPENLNQDHFQAPPPPPAAEEAFIQVEVEPVEPEEEPEEEADLVVVAQPAAQQILQVDVPNEHDFGVVEAGHENQQQPDQQPILIPAAPHAAQPILPDPELEEHDFEVVEAVEEEPHQPQQPLFRAPAPPVDQRNAPPMLIVNGPMMDRPPSPRKDDSPVALTAREEWLIKEAEQRALIEAQQKRERSEIRQKGFQEEVRIRTKEEVIQTIRDDFQGAMSQIVAIDKPLAYLVGPEDQYQDPKWSFSSGHLGTMDVGICHYSSDPRQLRAEHLATVFEVTINQQKYPITLFGIFDPQIGSRASSYLVKNLPKELAAQLVDQNRDEVSHAGIWNAITQTFIKLNLAFIQSKKQEKIHPLLDDVVADHGSSATIVFTFNNVLWTAHIGNSRAILDNGGNPVQLSEDPHPLNPKYRGKVISLGGTVDERGLVNGKLDMATGFGHYYLRGAISSVPCITFTPLDQIVDNSHVLIGTHGIFKVTSTRKLATLLHEKPNLAKNLAHDCVYSVYSANQKSKSQVERERSLSCCVIAIKPENDWEQI